MRSTSGLLVLTCTLCCSGHSISQHGFIHAVQEAALGRSIYERNSESVVLLLARGASGAEIAFGTAFWIAPKILVTNAHVVDAGQMFVKLGPVKLPCAVVAVDHQNDLATLRVDADISSTPLKLSTSPPKPGDVVYAIGNPEGLENAISQGIVSGIRKVEGRELIQITAPISHGSSGGPVFNAKGEVIGVTVGMLDSGQNLNFAVPARFVADLLTEKPSLAKGNPKEVVAGLQIAADKLNALEYSDSPDSEYQKSLLAFRNLANIAVNEVGNDADAQLRISELALLSDPTAAIEAARRACSVKPSLDAHMALINALQFQSWYVSESEKSALLAEAEQHARAAVSLSPKNPTFIALYSLGDVQEDRSEFSESEQDLKKAASIAQGDTQKSQAYRSLARVCWSEGKLQESDRWFQQLTATGMADGRDWDVEGDRLVKQKQYKDAADAYSNAASKGVKKDSCYAATNYFVSGSDDSALAAARLCITENTGSPDTDKLLGNEHWLIATILNNRGVYTEALSHAKESTVLDPSRAASFDAVAEALIGLQRFHEAVEASEQAIRLSDGGVASYHFNLGSAYFNMENWQLARQSYEKAAELDQTDSSSAYNVAICLTRQEHYTDAAQWYEEYLRRKPNAPDKADVLNRIQILKR